MRSTRSRLQKIYEHPLFPIAVILLMAVIVQTVLFSQVTSDSGLFLLEDAWRFSEQISELYQGIRGGDARLEEVWSTLAELRAEQGILRLLHLAPYTVSFLLFEVSEASSHLFRVANAALSVLLIYGIGRMLHQPKSGLMAAFLWGLFPLAADYNSSELFTGFYFLIGLSSPAAFLWAQRRSWWPGYLLSLVGVAICLAAIPSLGIGLLAFILLISIATQLPPTETKERLIRWALATLAAVIVIVHLALNPVSEITWGLYTSLLMRREFIIIFPLFFFAFGWAMKERWPSRTVFLLGLGLAYMIYTGLKLWPPNRLYLTETTDGLGALILLSPIVMLTAIFLTSKRPEAQVRGIVCLAAVLVVLLSLGYSQLVPMSAAGELMLNILQIAAGLGFLALMALPWVMSQPSLSWRGIGFSAIFISVTISLVFYTVSLGQQRHTLNENALVAADRVERFIGLQDIYVCPTELGVRIWYLQAFKNLMANPEEPAENLYKNFPRDLERREQGLLIVGSGCPKEVSSIFDIRAPEVIGNSAETQILIFYVPGN